MKQLASTGLIIAMLAAGCGPESDRHVADRRQAAAELMSARPYSAAVQHRGSAPDGAMHSSLPKLDESSDLSDYLAYAALNNPGLQAAFDQWKAALERIPQVRALPDPQFTYAYFLRRMMVDPQRQSFAVMQTFPWFGKLDLRADAAGQAAQAAQRRFDAARLQLFFEVRDAWYEYYYLARSTEITRENMALLEHLESIALSRYRAAAAAYADVVRAQVESGKIEDDHRALAALREPVMARLNAALNRPVDAEIPFPREISQRRLQVTDRELIAVLVESSPELQAMDFEITAAQREIELARKDYYPDLTFGFEYMNMAGPHGDDPLLASVSVNIPIWRQKYAAGVREARLRHQAARRLRSEAVNSLSSRLKMTLYRFRDAERKIELYGQTLLPKAEESLNVTESGYRAQTGTFTDLIDAQRILLEFSLAYERALADRAQSLAELEMIVGREITAAGNPEPGSNVEIESVENQ